MAVQLDEGTFVDRELRQAAAQKAACGAHVFHDEMAQRSYHLQIVGRDIVGRGTVAETYGYEI